MKRLLITRPTLPPVIAALEPHFEIDVGTAALDEDGAAQALAGYDAILPTLGDAFTARTFEAAREVRCGILANFGVGYNHIDVAAARRCGVPVTNTPGALTDATADLAMTLILAVARRAGEGERLLRSGGWTGWEPTQMLGTHVTGKVLGIVGMGRIGQAVAHRGHHGFSMPVLYYNRSAKDLPFPARRIEQLGELMAAADIVVVAVPGGNETAAMIDAAALAAMRPGGIFVNISRGEVVDEPALIDALERRAIGGAGLDVYAAEPAVPKALRRLENCVLLPHLGSATEQTRVAMGMVAVDNLLAWRRGAPLPNPV